MGPLTIVEVHPVIDHALGCEAVRDVLQIDRFIFERAPQAFDEDIVQVSPSTIHADPNLCVGECGDLV